MPLPTTVSELNILLVNTASSLTEQRTILSTQYADFNQSEDFRKPAFDNAIAEHAQLIFQYKFIAGELSAAIAALDQISQHQGHLVGVAGERLCEKLALSQKEALEETLRISETILGRMAEKVLLLETLKAHIIKYSGTRPEFSSLYSLINLGTKVYKCFDLSDEDNSIQDDMQTRLAARLAAAAEEYNNDDDISWPSTSDNDNSGSDTETLLPPRPGLLLQFQQLAIDGADDAEEVAANVNTQASNSSRMPSFG